MGVTTEADNNISEAKEHLSKAYSKLLNVLDEDTWGHADFKDSYIDDVQMVVIELLKLKRKL